MTESTEQTLSYTEQVLCSHLVTVESLDVLAREGFLSESVQELIPTEFIRKLTDWSLRYYFKNGRTIAPTPEAIQETWSKELERGRITIDFETESDSVEWVVEQLRAQFATFRTQEFVRTFATTVFSADPDERTFKVQQGAHDLYLMAQSLQSRHREQNAADGIAEALERYEIRRDSERAVQGMTFGLPLLDNYTLGTHPGELAVFAAASGAGKSWVGGKVAINEWVQGRLAALFTLENDLEMTFDRLACIQARVDYAAWQRGQVTDEGRIELVRTWAKKLADSDHAPVVLMPERGNRTVPAIVRKAIVLGAQSLIIDQLSFVEHNPKSKERQRWALWGETIHELKNEISEGRDKLPCLLLHQISREGVRAAAKTGRYEMDHLAEASEIERTADFVYGLYRSKEDREKNEAVLQMLKARRVEPKDWSMAFRLEVGDIRILHEHVIEEGS